MRRQLILFHKFGLHKNNELLLWRWLEDETIGAIIFLVVEKSYNSAGILELNIMKVIQNYSNICIIDCEGNVFGYFLVNVWNINWNKNPMANLPNHLLILNKYFRIKYDKLYSELLKFLYWRIFLDIFSICSSRNW